MKEKECFYYLGSLITTDASYKTEIRKRIAMKKAKFYHMHAILFFSNRILSMELETRLLKCNIWSILMYECEASTTNNKIEGNIEAAEML